MTPDGEWTGDDGQIYRERREDEDSQRDRELNDGEDPPWDRALNDDDYERLIEEIGHRLWPTIYRLDIPPPRSNATAPTAVPCSTTSSRKPLANSYHLRRDLKFCPANNELLFSSGDEVQLNPSQSGILYRLYKADRQTVSLHDLACCVGIQDGAARRVIAQLRDRCDDDNHILIREVPGVGYALWPTV